MKKIILKGTEEQKAKQFYKLMTSGRTWSREKDVIYYEKFD